MNTHVLLFATDRSMVTGCKWYLGDVFSRVCDPMKILISFLAIEQLGTHYFAFRRRPCQAWRV